MWSDTEPADRRQGIVFPGEQTETWTFDEDAQAWYYHRFYDFQPDLNWSQPGGAGEIKQVMGFWLQLGASGFRIDAAPFVLELVEAGRRSRRRWTARSWTTGGRTLQWRRGDAVLLCEANVDPGELSKYTGLQPDGPERPGAHALRVRLLNARLWLALARRRGRAAGRGADGACRLLQDMAQWATFLRNHDELDLCRLTDEQRNDVFACVCARAGHAHLRARHSPPVGAHVAGRPAPDRLAYALQFALPGTPVLRYGEEIGMGENLALPDRNAMRTPMQWED